MIAIVGGGISGLATAFELDRRGADCVVLEAGARPGGVIRSARVEGRVLDWGPQRTRLTGRVTAMIDALGLRDRVVTAPPDLDLYVYRDGRLHAVPFSVRDFLTSDIVSFGAKARLFLEPLARPADPEESVADYFRRKVGRELYEVLIAPLYGGLYGSDPADMRVGLSLGHVLRQFGVRRSLILPLLRRGGRITPPPACTFEEGMQELPLAIAKTLGERVQLQTPVRAVIPDGARWRIECDHQVLEAEAVVLATPARVVSDLLARAAPEAAAAIGSLCYNPLAVVHLDAETELRGLGFQVAFTETDLTLRGVTFNDSLFGRRDLYTAYLGGSRHPEVSSMGEADLAALARREFRACTGYEAEVLSVALEHMPAWDVTWAAIEDLRLPRGLHVVSNWRSRPGLPGRLAEAAAVADMLATPPAAGHAASGAAA